MLTVVKLGDVDALNAMMAASWAVQVRLYVNPLVPTPATVIGDITECSSPWYSLYNPVWSPAFINGLGKGQANGSSNTWVTGAAEPTVTVYGAFWTGLGGVLHAIDPFDVPVSLTVPALSIPYQPILTAVEDVP